MSYTIFEGKKIGNGGTREVHLEWGGHEMIIQTGDVPMCRPKWGDLCVAKGRAKKGTPLSLFLAPSLNLFFPSQYRSSFYYSASKSLKYYKEYFKLECWFKKRWNKTKGLKLHRVIHLLMSTFLPSLPIYPIIRSMYICTQFTYLTYHSLYIIINIYFLPLYPVYLLNLSFAPSRPKYHNCQK